MNNFSRLSGLTLGLAFLCSWGADRPERVRLTFSSDEKSCPDQRALETSIAARLGYAPFEPSAKPEVRTRIVRRGSGLTGTVEAYDASGVRTGRRVFDSPTADCTELASSIELAITISIDPLALDRPAPPPPAPAPAPAPPPPPPQPGEPVHFSAATWVSGDLGFSPELNGSLALQISIRYRALEVLAEGWAEFPSATRITENGSQIGTAHTELLSGSVLVCGVYRFIGVCAAGGIGALQVSSDIHGLATRETVALPLAGARLRGIFELGRLSLQPFIEADFVLDRVTVETGHTTVWVTPPIAGRLGLALSLRFF